MHITWLRALGVLVPLCLFGGSMVLLDRPRTLCTMLQGAGSGCFLGVTLAYSPLTLRSWTNWLAIAGLTIFSVSFLISTLSKK